MSKLFIPGELEFRRRYEGYKPVPSQDPQFEKIYRDVSYFLGHIEDNKDIITSRHIKSSKGHICVIPYDNCRRYLLVWDDTYWEQFQTFVEVYENIFQYLLKEKNEQKAIEYAEREENYLFEQWLIYLSHYSESSYDNLSSNLLAKANEMGQKAKHEDNKTQFVSDCLLVAKLFVLFHEFEHILYDLDNSVYQKDVKVFDLIVKKYRNTNYTQEQKSKLPTNEINKAIDAILDNQQTSLEDKNEIYNDWHAFFEMMDFFARAHGYQDHYRYKLYVNIGDYYLPVKLLKIFESSFNCLKKSTDIILERSHLPKEYRLDYLKEWNEEYQKQKVYKRDYLSHELIAFTILYEASLNYDESKFSEIQNFFGESDFMKFHDQ